MGVMLLVMIIFGVWQVIKGSIIKKHTSYIRKEGYNNWGLAISLFIFFLTVWSMNANDFNMNTSIYIGVLLGVLSIYITFIRKRNTKLTIYNIDEKKVIDIFNSILKSHRVGEDAEVFIELDNSSMYTYIIRNHKKLTNHNEILSDFITALKTVKEFNIKVSGEQFIILGAGAIIFAIFILIKDSNLFISIL